MNSKLKSAASGALGVLLLLVTLLLTACSSDFERPYVEMKDPNEEKPLTSYTYIPTDKVKKQIELDKQRVLVAFYEKDIYEEEAILSVTEYMNGNGYDILSISHDEPYGGSESVFLIYEKVDYLKKNK